MQRNEVIIIYMQINDIVLLVYSSQQLRQNQGCESSSFQLIPSFLKIFFCQNLSFFFYFWPIFGSFTQFHAVFPCVLSVASHTSAK